MTEQEAYRILGLPKGADTEQIRKKYRELILQVHPDMLTGGSSDLSPAKTDVRKINQAYSLLRRVHSISRGRDWQDSEQNRQKPGRSHQHRNSSSNSQSYGKWNAPCNPHAYCPREIYCRAEDADGAAIGVFPIARGKYLWSLDEDFPLFLKSIYQCAKELLEQADTDASGRPFSGNTPEHDRRRNRAMLSLTFLLTQQFIDARAMLRSMAVRVDPDESAMPGKTVASDKAVASNKAVAPGETVTPEKTITPGESDRSSSDAETWRLPAMLEISWNLSLPRKALPKEGEMLFPAAVRNHRLFVQNAAGQELGYLSFQDDRLYYILVPLFEQRRVLVRIRTVGPPTSKGRRQKSARSVRNSAVSAWQDLELQIRFAPMQGSLFPESINDQIAKVLREYQTG